tara:strand:+ start:2795 stop:3805 length:1011 start_codon:yes stop_codon:yes gene_type:complete
MKNKIVSVAGYGSTGSSAVVNYLEEFECCNVMGGEFRILQDPDGIEDLCYNLSNSWGWNRSDAYIRRFIKYTNVIGRRITLHKYGENLNKTFNYKFFKYRNEFLDSIIDTKWKGHWFYHDYHERNFIEVIIENIKRSLSWHFGFSREWLRRNTKKSDTFFVRSDIEIYHYAKIFINKLFSEYDINSEHLIFDQMILPYHMKKFDLLLPNLKQIVVDRDPRDVYLDAKNYNAYPITNNIQSFISFYETARNLKKIKNDERNLKINFEDLIYNYNSTTKGITDFLNITGNNEKFKYSRFNPNISIKNTKTWLRETNPKVLNDIKTIENKLEKWCYDFK